MTPTPVIGILLALAALGIGVISGWVAATLGGGALRRAHRLSPAARHGLLVQARLTPLALVAVLVPAQIVAFIRFEAGGAESAGPLLVTAAALGLAFGIDAVWRAIRSARQTRDVVRTWLASARPLVVRGWNGRAWSIQREFPVVAVVGVVRPQLFVASQVASACSEQELAAIVAHEAAHVTARDNLARLLFAMTPGAAMTGGVAETLERAWMVAAEHAADARARRTTPAIDLAGALTKVARLAADAHPAPLAASALIGGQDLESRVRWLLEPDHEHPPRRSAWLPMLPVGLALAAAAVLFTSPVLAGLHELFELLVRR